VDEHRFAGYRIIEFSQVTRDTLGEVALRLIPHEREILDSWIGLQWRAWQPPGLSRDDLRQVFGQLLRNMLRRLEAREIQQCTLDLEETGADLARRRFPFEALIVSIHFLEESYMPLLITDSPEQTRQWLIGMDEFLHAALAAMATSYFNSYREELLDRAEVGRIVQEGLLASIPTKTSDLDIAHVYVSARERAQLGGDFLDFFETDGCTAFIIGDLSGHGVEAAADSVMLRSLFKGFMRESPDLTDAMSRLNRVLMKELADDQFATALALSYDVSGRVSLVSAGHPYPFVCHGGACRLVELSGTALAVNSASTYTSTQISLEPGGLLVAYTDGLTEARKQRVFFGEEGVIRAVSEAADASARGVAEHLVYESLRHAGGKFSDDVAVLVLKRSEVGE